MIGEGGGAVHALAVGRHLGSPAAGTATAELWYAWVGAHTRDIERFSRAYLSAEERAHLDGYRIREAAERYVVTRALVRTVLADRLGISPPVVVVNRTDTGKPVVAAGVHFNISHSGDLILLALCDDRPIGVDVERKREVSRVEALAGRWLTEAERRDLDRLRLLGQSDSDAFLRIWSLKEARLKALGVGIAGASRAKLDGVSVTPLDQLLDGLVSGPGEAGYVGALAFA